MIKINKIFNEKTLNIFTDASIKYYNTYNESVGCSGAVAVIEDKVIEEKYNILRNTTNNNSEIDAIRSGIILALKYKNIDTINLFSDSKICIYGLREWIFNWINNSNNGILYNSSGKPVSNQSIFLDIIYIILNNNLKIQLYHQRGHININKEKDILKSYNDFKKYNFIKSELDINIIKKLSYYNNYVDLKTRSFLNLKNPKKYETLDNYIKRPFNYYYNNFDYNKYKNLLY